FSSWSNLSSPLCSRFRQPLSVPVFRSLGSERDCVFSLVFSVSGVDGFAPFVELLPYCRVSPLRRRTRPICALPDRLKRTLGKLAVSRGPRSVPDEGEVRGSGPRGPRVRRSGSVGRGQSRPTDSRPGRGEGPGGVVVGLAAENLRIIDLSAEAEDPIQILERLARRLSVLVFEILVQIRRDLVQQIARLLVSSVPDGLEGRVGHGDHLALVRRNECRRTDLGESVLEISMRLPGGPIRLLLGVASAWWWSGGGDCGRRNGRRR